MSFSSRGRRNLTRGRQIDARSVRSYFVVRTCTRNAKRVSRTIRTVCPLLERMDGGSCTAFAAGGVSDDVDRTKKTREDRFPLFA